MKAAAKIAQLRQLGLGTAQIGGDDLRNLACCCGKGLRTITATSPTSSACKACATRLPHHAARTESRHTFIGFPY